MPVGFRQPGPELVRKATFGGPRNRVPSCKGAWLRKPDGTARTAPTSAWVGQPECAPGSVTVARAAPARQGLIAEILRPASRADIEPRDGRRTAPLGCNSRRCKVPHEGNGPHTYQDQQRRWYRGALQGRSGPGELSRQTPASGDREGLGVYMVSITIGHG